MVKPLTFKGDKKVKKRKVPDGDGDQAAYSTSFAAQDPIIGTHDDDSWVTAEAATDIAGPVLFVLPSTTPTCIACDANGEVFASKLENMVEENSTTAEPHDVRQVWTANRVTGTEEISFKGHHGRWAIQLCSYTADGNHS